MPGSDHDSRDERALEGVLSEEDVATLTADPSQTIVPARKVSDAASHDAASVIDRLMAGAEPRVEIEDTLGEGGMGVVKLARQVALGRPVAVKSLHPGKRNPSNTTKLLHEAWVIGSLEHPNVVPVYDIDVDSDGTPLVVLKRIEGTHWGTLMSAPDQVEARFGATDLLEWNLHILMQVLNAVRFAHSRDIIHRDLKPENVMIGEFGEVYLVDWGLALSLHPDDARLPTAGPIKKLAGTPRYMAPEMLSDSDVPLTHRTDVYLAGAILYHVLTGKPPHHGATPPQVLFSIIKSAPVFPDSVPSRLAAICRQAMHKDPAERFASAEEMRLALQRYLQHRGSERLAEQARSHLTELAETLRRADTESDDEIDTRHKLYKLFGASRFGFHEALAAWPENQQARDGLDQAIVSMIEYELERGGARSAATLLAELDDPPEGLRSRIDAALAERAAEKQRLARLERLERRLDARVGQRARLVVAVFLGVYWVLSPWLNLWLSGGPDPGSRTRAFVQSILFSAALIAVGVGLVVWARRRLSGSVINLRYFVILTFVYVLITILMLGMLLADAPMQLAMYMRTFCVLCLITMLAITMEHRFWPSVVAYAAAFLIVAAEHSLYPYANSLANLSVTITAVVIWRNPRPRPTDSPALAPGSPPERSPAP